MKYVITGASGNTGKIVAEKLLEAGNEVVVISRNPSNVKALTDKGAIAAIGDLTDDTFLTNTFQGADAVYALIPPVWVLQESWRVFQRRIGTAITNALENSGVKHVVILSSMGSQMAPFGAGPVSGIGEWEHQLQNVQGLNVLALRPGYFLENLYAYIPPIKEYGGFGAGLKSDLKIPFTHTRDIAEAAIKHLSSLDFTGFSRAFVGGAADYSMNEVAKVIGEAIGLPALSYTQYAAADSEQGMIGAGVPEQVAKGYVLLFEALNSGIYLSDYERTPENTTATTLQDFAAEFAQVYKNS